MFKFLAPLCIGFLVSLAMMLALRPIASHLGLVDVPGVRKTHSGEVPVIGGIAMFLGMLAAALSVDVSWAGGGTLRHRHHRVRRHDRCDPVRLVSHTGVLCRPAHAIGTEARQAR